MARAKKAAQDDGPRGAPEWIVTFTDMISLLVTFFVLLITFSSLDHRQLMKIDAWMPGSDRILQEDIGSVVQETIDYDRIAATDLRRGAIQPHVRPREELLDNIDEMGQKLAEDQIEIDFNEHLDGLSIVFEDEACFEPGSVELSPALQEGLTQLGEVLSHYPFLLVVEGHTDASFRPTAMYPTAEDVSVARAAEAARHLLATSPMEPKLVQVAGLGSARPRSEEASPEGRRANRRVEVRILSLSKARASHLEALKRAREDD